MLGGDCVEKKRITVTIGVELYDLLNEQAEMMGTSVPALLVFNATEYLKQQKMINQLPLLMQQAVGLKQVLDEKEKE